MRVVVGKTEVMTGPRYVRSYLSGPESDVWRDGLVLLGGSSWKFFGIAYIQGYSCCMIMFSKSDAARITSMRSCTLVGIGLVSVSKSESLPVRPEKTFCKFERAIVPYFGGLERSWLHSLKCIAGAASVLRTGLFKFSLPKFSIRPEKRRSSRFAGAAMSSWCCGSCNGRLHHSA
jgi:hypothetical protein